MSSLSTVFHLEPNFKTYSNTIRLTEEKRLLQETDLPISDIAYITGYNHISHFNRVFKKELEVSPRECRREVYFFLKKCNVFCDYKLYSYV